MRWGETAGKGERGVEGMLNHFDDMTRYDTI